MYTPNKTLNSFTQHDGFSDILREAAESFSDMRVDIKGEGFKEILSESGLFDTYVNKLSEQLDATEAAQFEMLANNCRQQILAEDSTTGIQPIASLSLPTIRKMWVKVAVKNGFPTQPVDTPKFQISWMSPYILDADGITKHKIPQELRDLNNKLAEKTPLSDAELTLPLSKADILPANASLAVGDAIDPKFWVETLTVQKDTTGAETKVVKVHEMADIRGRFDIAVDVKFDDGTIVTDQVLGSVDFQKATLSLVSLGGLVLKATIKGSLTSEFNTRSENISYDLETKDCTIGTGAHLNAALPLEFLQDSMAMYNIDGTLETVDLMSSVVAQKLDQELINFMKDSFENTDRRYLRSFDVRPSASYAGSPKEWREELKTVINQLALKMKNDSAMTNCKFVIFGNPMDVDLITNVDWTFNGSTDTRGGVDVDFNLGAYAGSNKFEIVSSMNIVEGELIVICVPNTDRQMTYKYYPYTFNVERQGYLNPLRTNVPSIMMTKRHTIEEFMPLVGIIEIKHNDASMLDGLPRSQQFLDK